MKSTTIFFLFKLEQCVEQAYYRLNQCTHGVSEKFKFQQYFVSFLRQNCITNKRDANTLHQIYDKNFIIKRELVIYGLNYIIHAALNIR